jgi:cyclopropane fatty-acyl-phospholipid synthase-like methyltransferase
MPDKRRSRPLWLLLIALLLAASPASAQDPLHHDDSESDHYTHGFENPERYAEDWNDPERDEWQKPDAVIEAMGIDSGMTVVDLGTGTGYFLPYLAEAVGMEGRVRAVDIEPAMLNYVAEMATTKDLPNVDTVHAAPTDTRLGTASVDRILTVNTWHHIPNRGEYAAHLAERLTDGGTVWVIDFTREAPMGPPKKHRLDPQRVVTELERGGFEAEVHDLGLPHQYAVVGRLD